LERVVESLAIGHHRRGHDVTVATLLFGEAATHPFVEMLMDAGVRVYPIRLTPRAYLRERREIGELCRTLRPDVVHTHGYRIDLLDRRVAAGFGIPTVTTIHGFNMTGGLKGAFFEWLQRRNFRRFDAVVAVSIKLRDTALAAGVHPDRVHHIPNAWSGLREPMSREAARRELGLDGTATVVGWVGRLDPVKGGDVFLEALGRLADPRPVGVMIGYGQEAARLRRLADDLGLGESVRFYEEIRDAGRYFPAFDTYVLSSRSEGLPISILEAMAARTPIVATRVGGIMDALGEEEAWLVPSEDPPALAEAISDSLRDRAAAAERALRATDRLETDYALETFLERYEHVYRGIIDPARSPRGPRSGP
jgi:glycosyltransferase involved in cell wall biosynthesis